MRITELLQDATIDLGVKVNSKEEAIDHLVDLMMKGGNISDREEYKKTAVMPPFLPSSILPIMKSPPIRLFRKDEARNG